jgi:hypothetical protein
LNAKSTHWNLVVQFICIAPGYLNQSVARQRATIVAVPILASQHPIVCASQLQCAQSKEMRIAVSTYLIPQNAIFSFCNDLNFGSNIM